MTPRFSNSLLARQARGFDWDAQGAADAEVVNAFSRGKPAVRHRVAGQHSLAAAQNVVDDGPGSVDFFGRGLLVRLDRDQVGVLPFTVAVARVLAGANDFGN